MPTLNVSLDFTVDDGEAAKVTGTTTFWIANGAYSGAIGNPAGSLDFSANNVTGTPQFKYHERILGKTYEDWGVPAGSTITGVTNFTADFSQIETGTTFPNNYSCGLTNVKSSNSPFIKHSTASPAVGPRAWHTLPLVEIDDQTQFPVPSTDQCQLMFIILSGYSSGSTVNGYFDNISFDIDYTVGSPEGTGVLQSRDATISGTGVVSDPPVVAVRELTEDVYTLDVDGITVPMTQFNVTRSIGTETARVTVPVEFQSVIASATVITINLTAYDVYGIATDTELFTGALDTYSTTKRTVLASCIGAASYPLNVARDFGNVSYKTDDASFYSYRARVDPRFYPGDVGKFGVRSIDVNRVVFTVNEYQALMELSDIGQV